MFAYCFPFFTLKKKAKKKKKMATKVMGDSFHAWLCSSRIVYTAEMFSLIFHCSLFFLLHMYIHIYVGK